LLASCSFTAIEPSAPFVAVALNTDGSAEATAILLLKQLGVGGSRSE
jgi:hypothetical protein